MAAITNNPSLIESLRYSAGTDKVQSFSGYTGRSKTKYDSHTKLDARNNVVSEKPDSYSNAASFYRYKYNSPASQLLYTGRTFNEIEKPIHNKTGSAKEQNGQAQNHSPQNYNIYENAVGYYIVSNSKQTKSNSSSKLKRNNPMKRRLEQTYHHGNDNPPGSLVNIIYY